MAKGAIFSEGGMCGQGGHVLGGGMHGRRSCVAGKTATAADSTHSTGMHSCFVFFWGKSGFMC